MKSIRLPAVALCGLAVILFMTTVARGQPAVKKAADNKPPEKKPVVRRPIWEYKVSHCGFHSNTQTELNSIGEDGWELVQIVERMAVFKRPKSRLGRALQGSVQIEQLDDLGVMVVRGKQQDVKRITEMLRGGDRRLTPAATGDGKTLLEAYELAGLDPRTALAVLQTMLAGRPDVRMDVDQKSGRLYVLGRAADHATVRDILQKLLPNSAKKKAEAVKPKAKPGEMSSSKERKLRFEFRAQNWNDVLEWYAEQAGLSLDISSPVPGTFSYVDSRSFTVDEAMDMLNSVLLSRGFALLRRDRMLMVLDLEDGIPAELIPRVSPKELPERGQFEFVKAMFPIGRSDADQVRAEITPLLSPLGKVIVLPQTRQILVTERAGILCDIREIIESIDPPKH